jgi:hypothetical protein
MPGQCDECRGKGRRSELAKLDQGEVVKDDKLNRFSTGVCGHFPRAGEAYL